MEYVFRIHQGSTDARVAALAKIWAEQGYQVLDYQTPNSQKAIYFLEPRIAINADIWRQAVPGSLVFGYQTELEVPRGVTYCSLNADDNFVMANNDLTARALHQIINQNYHGKRKKMLVCGWGKLAAAIEKEFVDWQIAVLNFNFHKVATLKGKYGANAYFEEAPFYDFPIIINTIPKAILQPSKWLAPTGKRFVTPIIYDLASAPYGFNWNGVNQNDFNYQILPGLPGKYFPNEAAAIVAASMMRYLEKNAKPAIVLCLTGSACSFEKMLPILRQMVQQYEVFPVLSPNANVANRFVDINEFKDQIEILTGHQIITSIAGAETLSAISRLRASVIFPATGNTLAKLAAGITDTCVLMAVKALLRNNKPCVIGLATNDALSNSAKNIGALLNRRHLYFVPFGQDDVIKKPYSCVCDFSQVIATIDAALNGQQLQPLLLK